MALPQREMGGELVPTACSCPRMPLPWRSGPDQAGPREALTYGRDSGVRKGELRTHVWVTCRKHSGLVSFSTSPFLYQVTKEL